MIVAGGGSLLAIAGVVVLVGHLDTLSPFTFLFVTALFVVTESVTLHVELRRQTWTWTVSELALTIALVQVGGFWAAIARVVALSIILGVQRYSLLKSMFNLSSAVVEVAVAVAVLRAMPDADVTQPLGWLALLLAVLAADLVGSLMIAAAIAVSGGRPGRQVWRDLLIPMSVVGPFAVSVAIVGLMLTRQSSWAWVLIVPTALALVVLFRRFAGVARERRSLERVYDFARRVEQVTPDEAGTRQIVSAVRELLNAERVALWLPPYLDEEPRLIVEAENGALWYDGPGDPDDVFRRRAVEAAADGPVLVSRARAEQQDADALARRGATDLLGAPVTTAAGEPG